jgi:hypothetical protein
VKKCRKKTYAAADFAHDKRVFPLVLVPHLVPTESVGAREIAVTLLAVKRITLVAQGRVGRNLPAKILAFM